MVFDSGKSNFLQREINFILHSVSFLNCILWSKRSFHMQKAIDLSSLVFLQLFIYKLSNNPKVHDFARKKLYTRLCYNIHYYYH